MIVHEDCLSCRFSYSLPAGEPYDDGTVYPDYDVLVCELNNKIVEEENYCENYE